MKKNFTAMPRVSVIIPAYNCEKYIQEAIDSVLAQTHQDIEIIVVNDGSTDNTISRLDKYKSKIKVLLKPNGGTASARNFGIKASTGQYLVFLDNDDLLFPDAIENLVKQIILNRSFMAAYGEGYAFRDLNVDRLTKWTHIPKESGNIFKNIVRGLTLLPGQFLVDKECTIKIGGFDETEKMAEDWNFLLKFSRAYNFLYVPTPVLKKRVHSAMKTLNKKEHIIKKRLFVIKRAFGNESKQIARKYLSRKILAEWCRSEGLLCLSEYKDNEQGMRYLLKSLRLFPFQPSLIATVCYNKFVPANIKTVWRRFKRRKAV
jgi:glycosyltransferase involved in cell wall biosynthesis